jgi:glycosyltransferase involved in cell wall biosynthesis
VVNNNAESGTDEEVKKTRAKLFYEKKQGYGFGYQRGILEATGEYIFLSEPDGTFKASDIERFLVYANDFSVVIGTRTNQSSIVEGAAMGFWRKWADVLEGKIIEVLFLTNSLTDVGCTCKLLRRGAVEKLKKHWRTGNALFATELLLSVVTNRVGFIEIPITFKERVGESSLISKWWDLPKWGLRILWFIFSTWVRWIFVDKRK